MVETRPGPAVECLHGESQLEKAQRAKGFAKHKSEPTKSGLNENGRTSMTLQLF